MIPYSVYLLLEGIETKKGRRVKGAKKDLMDKGGKTGLKESSGEVVCRENIMSLMADARATKGGRIYGGEKGMVRKHVLKEDEEPYASTVLFLRVPEREIRRRCVVLGRDPDKTFRAIENNVSSD